MGMRMLLSLLGELVTAGACAFSGMPMTEMSRWRGDAVDIAGDQAAPTPAGARKSTG